MTVRDINHQQSFILPDLYSIRQVQSTERPSSGDQEEEERKHTHYRTPFTQIDVALVDKENKCTTKTK